VGEAMKKSELSLVHSFHESNEIEFRTSDGDPVCLGDVVSFVKKGEYSPAFGILTRGGGNLQVDCYKILIDKHVFYPVEGE
jgi:hypothetical protein